jgi:prepilin-type N-terminal cleavage/methylation domain-containing protein
MTMNRGFTLIEVTVSIFVIGVMVVASASLLHGVPASRLTLDQGLALSIAQNEIETLRAGGYATLPATGPFTDATLSALSSGAGAITVTDYDAKTKQVEVSVSWREQDLSSHTVTLTTLITQVGGLK